MRFLKVSTTKLLMNILKLQRKIKLTSCTFPPSTTRNIHRVLWFVFISSCWPPSPCELGPASHTGQAPPGLSSAGSWLGGFGRICFLSFHSWYYPCPWQMSWGSGSYRKAFYRSPEAFLLVLPGRHILASITLTPASEQLNFFENVKCQLKKVLDFAVFPSSLA